MMKVRPPKVPFQIFPGRFSEKSKSSASHRCLIALVLLLFCATAVFLSLFLIYFFKYEDRDKNDVCTTPECVRTAAAIVDRMDSTVDPCEDFAQYACGNFYKTATIPTGKTRYTSFDIASDRNENLIKGILQEVKPDDWTYMKNMRNLYMSCMDEDKIEEIGTKPYLDTKEAKEWPTLIGSTWPGSNSFNLNDVIAKYETLYVEPLFTYNVRGDLKDPSSQGLYLSDANLDLPKEYLDKPKNDSVIVAFQKLYKDFAVELGANDSVAEQDASDLIDFQKQLSAIMLPKEERRNSTKQYNKMTLEQLKTDYNTIDIPGALRAAFGTADIDLSDNQTVIVGFPSYLKQLGGVLDNADKRAIMNMFGFKYALQKVWRLTKKLREIKLAFDKVYRGKTEEQPRWKTCLGKAVGVFPLGMGKEYTARTFSPSAKAYMNTMIGHLEESFKSLLEDVDWMGGETKTHAHEKLKRISRKIGYPDADFEHEDIEEKYKNLTMADDSLYTNNEVVNTILNIEGLLKLRRPVDKNEWHMAPFEVNAYYSSAENEIVFPAGILEPPFFSEDFYDAINYGAIGVVIGHEMTHGFDDMGSQYDKDGSLNNWWQPEDKQAFTKKAQCIINQYGNYSDPRVNLKLNGINTQGENIADNGGVRQSFNAYKRIIAEKGEPKKMPGLDITDSQLFFLGYAQLWCQKITDSQLIMQINLDPHSPGRYRILGPLQNSPDFAKSFNCPMKSPMNPEKKCTVW